MLTNHFLGLLIGYGWILASTFFGASGFGIFISFAAELFALLIIYTIYRSKDEKENPRKYRKHQGVMAVWIAALPVIAIQFLMLRTVAKYTEISGEVPAVNQILFEWQVWVALLIILAIYFMNFSSKPTAEVVETSRNKFIVGMMLFTLIGFIGFMVIIISERKQVQFIWVLSAMVVVRLVVEFFLNKKFELVKTKK